jgi:sugar-specific transcriptional regulator TrmB
MNYLTNYYKNRCETLQEQVNNLQKLLNEIDSSHNKRDPGDPYDMRNYDKISDKEEEKIKETLNDVYSMILDDEGGPDSNTKEGIRAAYETAKLKDSAQSEINLYGQPTGRIITKASMGTMDTNKF